jgi:hypothetical protein
MSFSYRPLLVPGIALATAGVVALAPAVVAPPALSVAQPRIPVVQMHDIQLAGIGQDVYQFVTAWVQYGVELVQYGASLIPFIGGPIAAQIDIIYFDTIQPAVQDTVNFLAAVVQNPFNLIGETSQYLGQLYGLAYNFVASELAFFGFPFLPPLPPIAASVSPVAGLVAGRLSAAPAVETATVEEIAAEVGAEEIVAVEVPASTEEVPGVATGPEPVAVPEAVEIPVQPVEPVVEPVSLPEVAEPEVAAVPDVAPVVESEAVAVEPVEAASAPVAPAAGEVDRPTRAVRGEARASGKAARAGRGAAE